MIETFEAMSLPAGSWLRLALTPVACAQAHRFAGFIAECEPSADRSDFRQAAQQLRKQFISGATGYEN